jgi:hypothetical protein
MAEVATQILGDWLAHYDPIHRGWTREGIANGVCTTGGFCFPRIRGGYNLYRMLRDSSGEALNLVGAAHADASRIRTFPWVGHDAPGEYIYRLVPISGGGVENRTDITQVPVRFSESGQWIGGLPNAPTDLQLIPLSHGRMAVRWSYFPQGQEIAPAGFYLYSSDANVINYATVQSVIPYRPGQVHYQYVTAPQPDGIRAGWAVRAYAPSMREEQNRDHVFSLTRGNGPPANPAVSITLI